MYGWHYAANFYFIICQLSKLKTLESLLTLTHQIWFFRIGSLLTVCIGYNISVSTSQITALLLP